MLKAYYPYEYAKSVFTVDYEKLRDRGIKGIIFDIDNTLVHHGDDSTPLVDNFLKHLEDMGLKIVFLTNNDRERVERFNASIGAPFVCDAEKPNVKGYIKALEILGLEKHEAVVIGDQMFVDIVGANRAGIPSILVHFIVTPGEKWLGAKRYAEMVVLWFFRRNKKLRYRLGNVGKEEQTWQEETFAR